MYVIEPMTRHYAETIATWQYPREYAIYSFTSDEATLAELLNGEYLACTAQGALVGYFCFGRSAQIPTEEPYAPDADTMDIGLGLAPALCGQGYGRGFLQSGMDYAERNLRASGLRLVVAAFNQRAIALYRHCGFVQTGEAIHQSSKARFLVMRRPFRG